MDFHMKKKSVIYTLSTGYEIANFKIKVLVSLSSYSSEHNYYSATCSDLSICRELYKTTN